MAKTYALRLALGGAPATPHVIYGVPGEYRPDEATLLDDVGLSLDAAQALSNDPGCPLELGTIERGQFVPVPNAPPKSPDVDGDPVPAPPPEEG